MMPIFNISRCNFATIESHSTNWKLQDFHRRCQLLLFRAGKANFALADGIQFPADRFERSQAVFKPIFVQIKATQIVGGPTHQEFTKNLS